MKTSQQINTDEMQTSPMTSSPDPILLPGVSPKVRMITAASLIGVVCGVAAWLLKLCIGHVTHWLGPMLSHSDQPDWWVLIIPVAGIMLTGIYQRYVLHAEISHGVDRLVDDLNYNRLYLKPNRIWGPMIGSTLTLGFGGSAGSEGPIAYTGAAIGSNLGRLLKLSQREVYVLIGCGAAAGIAGIFKAPVGAALFALEVLGITLTTISVVALFSATICGALTAYILSGYTIDIPWTHNILTFDPQLIVWILAFGIFCGVYSYYYSEVMTRMQRLYDSIRNPWITNFTSGLLLAVSILLFPSLYGEGYDVIGSVINADWHSPFADSAVGGLLEGSQYTAIIVLGGVLMLKSFACSASNSGGGVAGDFAPTLFAGCIAGVFFTTFCNQFMGQTLPSDIFAFIGMAGVMSGVIRAPLMAVFLAAEMCNGFDYLLPLVIVSMISYAMVMWLTHRHFYNTHRRDQGWF